MEIVINTCHGGFSLSPTALQMLAKAKGKECYFFEYEQPERTYKSITLKEAQEAFVYHAYSVPNPGDYRLNERGKDGLYKEANERAEKISLDNRPKDRADVDLVRVVKMLGKKANGKHADLKIVKIPDGVEWTIQEYDGAEWIAEKHRTWN